MEKRTFGVPLLIDSILNGDIHNVPGKAYNNQGETNWDQMGEENVIADKHDLCNVGIKSLVRDEVPVP